jgi:ribosomal protein S18 acetylase RimI-like enzyme
MDAHGTIVSPHPELTLRQPAVTIRPMTAATVRAVSDLHIQAVPDMHSARLGRRYVHAFLSWFATSATAIAYVAELEPGTVVGYVIGAPVGYAAVLNVDLAWVGLISVLRRPWMLLHRGVWGTLWARLGFVLGRSAANTTGLPEPVMSLVGITVAPAAAGKGVGFALMKAFEERARAMQMASLRLSVYPDNRAARRLYERCGWKVLPQPPSASGTIYYGLLLR